MCTCPKLHHHLLVGCCPGAVGLMAQLVAINADSPHCLQTTGDGALPTATAPRQPNYVGVGRKVRFVLQENKGMGKEKENDTGVYFDLKTQDRISESYFDTQRDSYTCAALI